jgi:hypothetical protein
VDVQPGVVKGGLSRQDVGVDVYGFSRPLARVRVRTAVVPTVAAVVCAAVAALVEVRVVASAQYACDVGINAAASSWLLLFELPLLWVVQAIPDAPISVKATHR